MGLPLPQRLQWVHRHQDQRLQDWGAVIQRLP